MKVNLSSRIFEIEKGVTVKVRPLDQGDYQRVMAFMASMSPQDNKELGEEQRSAFYMEKFSSPILREVSDEIVPKYCKNLEGMTIEDETGERAAVVDDLTKHTVFMLYCVNILTHLFTISTMSPKQENHVKK